MEAMLAAAADAEDEARAAGRGGAKPADQALAAQLAIGGEIIFTQPCTFSI
jgi:hypothetical protein